MKFLFIKNCQSQQNKSKQNCSKQVGMSLVGQISKYLSPHRQKPLGEHGIGGTFFGREPIPMADTYCMVVDQ